MTGGCTKRAWQVRDAWSRIEGGEEGVDVGGRTQHLLQTKMVMPNKHHPTNANVALNRQKTESGHVCHRADSSRRQQQLILTEGRPRSRSVRNPGSRTGKGYYPLSHCWEVRWESYSTVRGSQCWSSWVLEREKRWRSRATRHKTNARSRMQEGRYRMSSHPWQNRKKHQRSIAAGRAVHCHQKA